MIRKRAKRPDREFIEEQDKEAIELSTSIDSYQEGLMRESLHEALDSLPEMYREVLTLHYLGGMKSKEIAQFLGKPASTIKQHLSRVRAKLKKEMIDNMSATFARIATGLYVPRCRNGEADQNPSHPNGEGV